MLSSQSKETTKFSPNYNNSSTANQWVVSSDYTSNLESEAHQVQPNVSNDTYTNQENLQGKIKNIRLSFNNFSPPSDMQQSGVAARIPY